MRKVSISNGFSRKTKPERAWICLRFLELLASMEAQGGSHPLCSIIFVVRELNMLRPLLMRVFTTP